MNKYKVIGEPSEGHALQLFDFFKLDLGALLHRRQTVLVAWNSFTLELKRDSRMLFNTQSELNPVESAQNLLTMASAYIVYEQNAAAAIACCEDVVTILKAAKQSLPEAENLKQVLSWIVQFISGYTARPITEVAELDSGRELDFFDGLDAKHDSNIIDNLKDLAILFAHVEDFATANDCLVDMAEQVKRSGLNNSVAEFESLLKDVAKVRDAALACADAKCSKSGLLGLIDVYADAFGLPLVAVSILSSIADRADMAASELMSDSHFRQSFEKLEMYFAMMRRQTSMPTDDLALLSNRGNLQLALVALRINANSHVIRICRRITSGQHVSKTGTHVVTGSVIDLGQLSFRLAKEDVDQFVAGVSNARRTVSLARMLAVEENYYMITQVVIGLQDKGFYRRIATMMWEIYRQAASGSEEDEVAQREKMFAVKHLSFFAARSREIFDGLHLPFQSGSQEEVHSADDFVSMYHLLRDMYTRINAHPTRIKVTIDDWMLSADYLYRAIKAFIKIDSLKPEIEKQINELIVFLSSLRKKGLSDAVYIQTRRKLLLEIAREFIVAENTKSLLVIIRKHVSENDVRGFIDELASNCPKYTGLFPSLRAELVILSSTFRLQELVEIAQLYYRLEKQVPVDRFRKLPELGKDREELNFVLPWISQTLVTTHARDVENAQTGVLPGVRRTDDLRALYGLVAEQVMNLFRADLHRDAYELLHVTVSSMYPKENEKQLTYTLQSIEAIILAKLPGRESRVFRTEWNQYQSAKG